jgi:beta-lactamase regulating signal transducer with metallopeptidase domain/Tol biopolymer transport system component
MIDVINDCVTRLNSVGKAFCTYAGGALVQSALLVLLLFAIDLLLRKRVRAVVRYCLWLLVLAKLVLPPTLALPTGIGYWLGTRSPATALVPEHRVNVGASEMAAPHRLDRPERSSGISPSAPVTNAIESAVTIPPAASHVTPVAWQGLVLLVWLAGVLAFAALLAQRVRFVKGLIATSAPAGGELLCLLEQYRRQIGVRRPVGLRTSDAVPSPAVCGLLRPTVLMPTSLVMKLSPEGLRAALIHELAHIKRADLWINAAQTLLQVIYFYNPFVWLANAMIRRTCEQAVDETVLVALGGEVKDYSNTLIDIGEMAFWKADLGLRLIGVAESKRALQWRIKHMLTRPIPKSARIGVLGTITILLIAALLLPMARAEKSDQDTPRNPPATAMEGIEKAPPASASDIVDPKTGLKFVVAKTISAAMDVPEDTRIVLSPNGKFLLFSSHVVPLDGSPTVVLKELQGVGATPWSWAAAWSPDGRWIAYNCEGIEVLPVSPETGRPTGPARKLLENNEGWLRGRIHWSADSQRILFVKWNDRPEREVGSIDLRDGRFDKQPDYAAFGLISPDGRTMAYSIPGDGMWVKPVGGGVARVVRLWSGNMMQDDAVVWTPDNQWVASAAQQLSGEQEIHLARPSDGQSLDVRPPRGVGTFVGRSPDGKKLLFYRSSFDFSLAPRVVSISGASGVSPDLPQGLGEIQACSWSSDSTALGLLSMNGRGEQQLWFLPLTGGDRVQFNMGSLGVDGPGLWWRSPLWSISPKGTKMLYMTQSAEGTGVWDYYIVSISLREGRALGPASLAFKGWRNPLGQEETVTSWSPDESKFAMANRAEPQRELWILSADGSTPIRIAQTTDRFRHRLSWSPDGKMIAFDLVAADRDMLQVIPAEGGMARTILSTPKGQLPPFAWSPDSGEVTVACNGTISGLPITGGSARVVLRLADAGCASASWLGWSPDGQHLAFYGSRRGEPYRLCLFSPSTAKITELENSPNVAGKFAWSPDGKMICHTIYEGKQVRSAGVLRELDVVEAVQKAPPLTAKKPAEVAAAPAVEPIPGPVFTDNFDDGLSKHWRFEDFPDKGQGPGQHRLEDGELVLTNARAYLDGIDWDDYIATVRICLKEVLPSGLGILGLNVRATPSQVVSSGIDWYGLGFFWADNTPPYLWLGINYRDASDTLRHGELSRCPCSLVPDRWYTLEFEVRGQHLRGYLDGKLMVEATDARLSKGKLWIAANNTRALFDDFSVRQLP